MSQTDFAKEVGLSRRTITKIETGEPAPSQEIPRKILRAMLNKDVKIEVWIDKSDRDKEIKRLYVGVDFGRLPSCGSVRGSYVTKGE